MDNQLQSLSKFFTEKLFRIPDYQRGYAWTEKQLKDYWTDIAQLEEGKNHYVGVLTLERVPSETYKLWEDDYWIIESKNFEPYYIVDGQQRLTTTIILLQALTETLEDNQLLNYTSVAEIRKRYIFDSKDNGISRSYIFGYEKDNPSYEFLKTKIFKEKSTSAYAREITIYTHNLEFAKNYFIERLRLLSIDQKEIIFKKVTQNLLFNIYAITSDIDVFIAFETMNNRGKPLSNLELLKNRLIYLSTKFSEENSEKRKLRKIINDGWKGIYHYLGKNKDNPLSDDYFLYSHCLIYFGFEMFTSEQIENEEIGMRRIGPRNTFVEFLLEKKFTVRNILETSEISKGKLSIAKITQYVENLQHAVEIWFNLFNPTLAKDFQDEEKVHLERLFRMGNKYFAEILLSFYLKKPKKDIRLKFLTKLEHYGFLMMFTSWMHHVDLVPTSIKLYGDKLSALDLIKQLDTKIEDMLNANDLIDRLSDRFRSSGFYGWNGIRYLLFEYESHLKNKSKAKTTKIDWQKFKSEQDDYVTVEHIYPQTAKDDCWKELFASYSLRERRILIDSLGNLLPLSQPKNSSLQNKCFKQKIESDKNYVGYKYGSYSENEISGLKEWTGQEILDRGINILRFIEERWAMDFQTDDKRAEILNLGFVKRKISKLKGPKPKPKSAVRKRK